MLPDILIKSAPHFAQSLRVELPGPRQVSRRHGLHALRIGSHFHDFSRQCFGVVWRDDVFRSEQFRNATHVRADARTSARHGFHQGARQSLSTRWHYKQVYGVKEITNRLAKAELTQETHISLN